ncbi:putative secreted protein (Por secretion system target) [Marinoscillum furvescens DSM 4134]|uniref:Putative secreted protein (Por secretion system target) n=2 Tax=Marinoscillum furvescens TaxID=1026 RepID=A0A3D9L566_MARFU|nr:putative secreted protein (Por secretion system target) [Marinoscillum furvescens DSM 4134]
MRVRRGLVLVLFFMNLVASSQEERKNVIFILADDLGWRDLSSYGSDFYQTPNIDALAASGVKFTDAYSANPLCSPTRASILTGQTSGRLRFTSASGHIEQEILDPVATSTASPEKKNGTVQSRSRLPLEYITFAEVLKGSGYRTAFMGKWHLGKAPYIPENQGFDVVVGGREHSGPPGPNNYFGPWNLSTLPMVPQGTHIAEALTDEAIDFIDETTDPFLLCLWYYDVHAPFQAKDDVKQKYEAKLNKNHIQRSPTMAAMIEVMDENIGRLLDHLEDRNLDENTIVIFTSDNGGHMYNLVDNTNPTNNAPLRSGKGNNYEGGVRVPMIVRAPGISKPGTVSEVVTQSVDHYPTMLDLLDIDFPNQVTDGESYVNALKGQYYERSPIFSVYTHDVPAVANRYNTSVRKGDWKLLKFYHDGPNREHRYELYNLADDIGETTNLSEQMVEKTQELAALIETYEEDIDMLKPQPNDNFVGNSEAAWFSTWDTELSLTDDNTLKLVSEGNTPYVETNHVPNYKGGSLKMAFDMRSSSNGNGRFLWKTSASNTFDSFVSFTGKHDGNWQSVTVDFTLGNTETLRGLRIQSSSGEGEIELRNIRLLSQSEEELRTWELDSKGVIAGLSENNAPAICTPQLEWDFERDASCWNLEKHLSGEVEDGALVASVLGIDPILTLRGGLNVPSLYYSEMRIRMKNASSASNGAIYFRTSENPSFVGNFVLFTLTANDDQFQDFIVDMSEHANWGGTVEGIRIDPQQPGASHGSVEISYIGFVRNDVAEPEDPVLTNAEVSGSNSFSIFPNPTSSGKVDIQLGSAKYKNSMLVFMSLDGKTLLIEKNNSQSVNNIRTDVSSFDPGVYLVQLVCDGKIVSSLRLIKR